MFISTMMCFACSAKIAEFPTEVVGIIKPSPDIETASNIAKSIGPITSERISSAVWDKCWSTKSISPLFILLRITGSAWNGSRFPTIPASANAVSTSDPREAPVNIFTLNVSVSARLISAKGTAFASPAFVNPLKPSVIPSLIHDAASSGVTIRLFNFGCLIRFIFVSMHSTSIS